MAAPNASVPSSPDAWTLDVICGLIRNGCFESEHFDFKEALPYPSDSAGKRRLAEGIVAFANSGVGFLVFGIRDDRGLSLRDRLVGVPGREDFPERFGALARQVTPGVRWQFRNPPIPLIEDDRVVHVVEVRRGELGPHALVEENGALRFLKRTNRGVEVMTHTEVRAMFDRGHERRMKMLLLRIELVSLREFCTRLRETDALVPFVCDTAIIDSLLPDIVTVMVERPAFFRQLHTIRSLSRLTARVLDLVFEEGVARNANAKDFAKKHKPEIDKVLPQLEIAINAAIRELDQVVGTDLAAVGRTSG